ncbi:ORF3 [Rana hepevirus]|uniref:ORF3 n=1 Tax=Rana hepevirus TaxID=2185281 RepID=UPI000E295158|nr:ORF3 [Rana hepevirus]AXJ14249.1 ORF3 [Rana hepevirus]
MERQCFSLCQLVELNELREVLQLNQHSTFTAQMALLRNLKIAANLDDNDWFEYVEEHSVHADNRPLRFDMFDTADDVLLQIHPAWAWPGTVQIPDYFSKNHLCPPDQCLRCFFRKAFLNSSLWLSWWDYDQSPYPSDHSEAESSDSD